MVFRAANAHGTAERSIAFSVQALAFAPPTGLREPRRQHRPLHRQHQRRDRVALGLGRRHLDRLAHWLPRLRTHPRLRQPRHLRRPGPGPQLPRRADPDDPHRHRDAEPRPASPDLPRRLSVRVLHLPLGHPVLFQQTFAGTPTIYRYDWNGDGAFEQVSATPVPRHAYPAAGLYTPVLQVSDGTTTHALAHQGGPILVQTSAPTIPEAPTGLVLDVVGEEFASTASSDTTHGRLWTLTLLIVRPRWTDRSADESGFNVYRSIAGGAYQLVATTPAGTTSTTNLRLPVGPLPLPGDRLQPLGREPAHHPLPWCEGREV